MNLGQGHLGQAKFDSVLVVGPLLVFPLYQILRGLFRSRFQKLGRLKEEELGGSSKWTHRNPQYLDL